MSKQIFYTKFSELENRLDPLYYSGEVRGFFESIKFPLKYLSNFVIHIDSGVGAGKKDQTDEKNGILQLRPTNIDRNGYIKLEKNIYIPKNNNPVVKINDILFNNTNSQVLVGKTLLIDSDTEMSFSNHMTRIQVKSEIMHPKYLWIILNLYQRKKVFFNLCTNWNNQSGIGSDLLKNLKIPMPSYNIQNKIISIMENAYQQKQQKEQEAKEKIESINAYLLDQLGVDLPEEKEGSIGDRVFFRKFSEVSGDRMDSTAHHSERKETIDSVKLAKFPLETLNNLSSFFKEILLENSGKLPYVGLENIQRDTGLYQASTEKESFSSAIKFKKGQILFPKLRPYLNKVYFAEFDGICSTEFHIFDSDKVNNEYLSIFLKSNIIVNQTKHLMSGNTLPRLQTEDIKRLLIVTPPLEIQEKIVTHVGILKDEAKTLKDEAILIYNDTKSEVERMILREEI